MHRIYVIHESEDHKIVLAQQEIRSQIVIKVMSLFEAAKRGLISLESCTMSYLQASLHQ